MPVPLTGQVKAEGWVRTRACPNRLEAGVSATYKPAARGKLYRHIRRPPNAKLYKGIYTEEGVPSCVGMEPMEYIGVGLEVDT